jgi:hypothetical protein
MIALLINNANGLMRDGGVELNDVVNERHMHNM